MRNTGIKLWSSLALVMLTTISIQAQEKEWGISLQGGLGAVNFENSKLTDGFNGGISVDYLYRLDQNWGLSAGISLGTYQLKIDQANYRNSYMTQDVERDKFEFRSKMDRFTETLSGTYFAIPLHVRYEIAVANETNIYVQAGLQYRFYSKVTSKLNVEQLQTSGYFSSWDAEIFDPEFMGFGKWDQQSQEQKLQLKNSLSVLGEVGVRQALGDQALYVGIYLDYDLANESKNKSVLVEYQAEGPERLAFNSRLQEQNDSKARLRMFAVGLKIRYAFGM